MAAIGIGIEGIEELKAAWARSPEIARAELAAAMTEADALLEREVKDSPEMIEATAHGLLRASIYGVETVSATQVIGVVGTAQKYAVAVELGARPHFPPIGPLVDWVKVKLGVPEREARSVAFLVARKIARTGTKGAFMFTRTWKRKEPAVRNIFRAARGRIAARLAGGTQ